MKPHKNKCIMGTINIEGHNIHTSKEEVEDISQAIPQKILHTTVN